METSYFNKYKKSNAMAIAVGIPKWYQGNVAKELCPSWDMVKKGYTQEEYVIYLKRKGLTAKSVYDKYKNNVMLCWEKNREECHRGYLAAWLEEELSVKIPEYKNNEEKKKTIQLMLF